MASSAPGTLAVELHPSSSTHWVATYYPMVATPAGRWADVIWVLHQHLLPATDIARESGRWLEVRSPDPGHTCYARHRGWAPALATGYAAALAAYHAETVEEPFSPWEVQQLRDGTVAVPAGQLSEWVLHAPEDESSDVRG